jgi:AraC-like DNA-binding protein
LALHDNRHRRDTGGVPESSPRAGTVRAGVTTSLQAFLARYPRVSADRLIQAAGIDPRRIGDHDAVIDQQQWVALLEAAAAETGDACFGMELALQVPWKDLGVLGYVLLNSPTVGSALDNSARYLAVQQTGGTLAVTRSPRAVRFSYAMADPRIVDYGQNAEGLFAMTVRMIREATRDPRWAPREIEFRHADPLDERHGRFFGSPIRFGRPTNTIVLAPADLDLRFVSADPGLLPVLERHAADCMTRMPRGGDVADEVRAAVIAAIGAGDPTIDAVAARLGTSPRSVQRRLQSAGGRSFMAIVDETRLALAERYLGDPSLTLTETAFLLGYSDLSAFSRAFRRWTGTTAQEFRRQHGA